MQAMLAQAGFSDVQIRRTKNYFPINLLLKQFLWACGLKVDRTPTFWNLSIGLKLGNILAIATA
jgi:hypothetical protein